MATLCFTGSRPNKLCGYSEDRYRYFVKDLSERLFTEFYQNRHVTRFISGGAQGLDQLAFWAVNRLKARGVPVQNVVYVPFEGQESRWVETGLFSQAQYRQMLQKADKVHTLAHVDAADYKAVVGALMARNRSMIDDSDIVLALYPDDNWTIDKGGTASALRYAASVKELRPELEIYRLDYWHANTGLALGEMHAIE